MTVHHEIMAGILCVMGVLMVIGILLYPQGLRYRRTFSYDSNWRQEPYIRVRIVLGICIVILGVVAVFLAGH